MVCSNDVPGMELVLAENVSRLLPESRWLVELAGGANELPAKVSDGDGPVERMAEVQFEDEAAVSTSEVDDHSDSLVHDQTDESSHDQSDETSEEWSDE